MHNIQQQQHAAVRYGYNILNCRKAKTWTWTRQTFHPRLEGRAGRRGGWSSRSRTYQTYKALPFLWRPSASYTWLCTASL